MLLFYDSYCPVCLQPSKTFNVGLSRQHHQGCACIEIRVSTKLLIAGRRLDEHDFPPDLREKLSQQARNAPEHQYLLLLYNYGLVRETKRRWRARMDRRKRYDPPKPGVAGASEMTSDSIGPEKSFPSL